MKALRDDQWARLALARRGRDNAMGWFLCGFVAGLVVSALAVVVYG